MQKTRIYKRKKSYIRWLIGTASSNMQHTSYSTGSSVLRELISKAITSSPLPSTTPTVNILHDLTNWWAYISESRRYEIRNVFDEIGRCTPTQRPQTNFWQFTQNKRSVQPDFTNAPRLTKQCNLLTIDRFALLEGEDWLNDELINSFLGLLVNSAGLPANCFFEGTLFTTQFLQLGRPMDGECCRYDFDFEYFLENYAYSKVANLPFYTQTSSENRAQRKNKDGTFFLWDREKYRYVFLPFNVTDYHWVAFIVDQHTRMNVLADPFCVAPDDYILGVMRALAFALTHRD
jgi:hypothetical protein